MITNLVPVTLFTTASFASFDLEANKGNDRIGFLITLFLVMVSIASGITAESPGANEITYIGERGWISMFFVPWGIERRIRFVLQVIMI